ncbi:3-oxoacyl-ACP reductase FabG [Rickettsiales bacterium LUAb2]
MLFDLNGKAALVSGASGGIGIEIVKALYKQGAKVGLISRSQEAMQKIKSELGDRIFCLTPRDITIEQEAKDLVEEASTLMGSVDILVNNAGITKDGLALRMSKEDFTEVLNVNLIAPFLLSKAVIAKMNKSKWGRIINISSVVGVSGNAGQANYSASKGGLNALTKTLAREYASRTITVNSISPGFIATKMTDVLTEAQKESLLSGVPLKRMGTPEEVAAAVIYLASEEAGYITGHNLNINGGMIMI